MLINFRREENAFGYQLVSHPRKEDKSNFMLINFRREENAFGYQLVSPPSFTVTWHRSEISLPQGKLE